MSFTMRRMMLRRRGDSTYRPDNFQLSINKEIQIWHLTDQIERFDSSGTAYLGYLETGGSICYDQRLINKRARKVNHWNKRISKESM